MLGKQDYTNGNELNIFFSQNTCNPRLEESGWEWDCYLVINDANSNIYIDEIGDYDAYGYIILPIYKYNVGYSNIYLIEKQNTHETNKVGVMILDKEFAQKHYPTDADVQKLMSHELNFFNKWVNNEFYSYTVKDKYGNILDSGDDFYEITSIADYMHPEVFDFDTDEQLYQFVLNQPIQGI